MKKIATLIIASILLSSCGKDCNCNQGLYYNYKTIIVGKGRNYPGKYFVIQSVEDSTLRSEIGLQNWYQHQDEYHRIDIDSIYYNHNLGDTLTFNSIRKDRFFHLNPKNRP